MLNKRAGEQAQNEAIKKDIEKRLRILGVIAKNTRMLLQSERIKEEKSEMSDVNFYALSFAIVLMKEIVKPHGQLQKDLTTEKFKQSLKEIADESFTVVMPGAFDFKKPPIDSVFIQIISRLPKIRDFLVDNFLLSSVTREDLKNAITLFSQDLTQFSSLGENNNEKTKLTLDQETKKEADKIGSHERTLDKGGSPSTSLAVLISSLERIETLKKMNFDTPEKETKCLYAICMLHIISGHCAAVLRNHLNTKKNILNTSQEDELLQLIESMRGPLAHFSYVTSNEEVLKRTIKDTVGKEKIQILKAFSETLRTTLNAGFSKFSGSKPLFDCENDLEKIFAFTQTAPTPTQDEKKENVVPSVKSKLKKSDDSEDSYEYNPADLSDSDKSTVDKSLNFDNLSPKKNYLPSKASPNNSTLLMAK